MLDWSEEIAFSTLPGVDRRKVNGPLKAARNDTCRALIGNPRGFYTQECLPPQDAGFIAQLVEHDFGPFRATGIRPAVASLQAIMADISVEQPEVNARLGTAGMLCCRLMRGSVTRVSSHAWGLAIDLKIDGKLDGVGNDRAQRGMLAVWPIFNRHRWVWGASFPKEDSMHFEASDQLVRDWAASGAFGPPAKTASGGLTIGDHGQDVLALQRALNRALPGAIAEDGIFGPETRGAVIAFQMRKGLKPSGIATSAVLKLLSL